MSSADFKDEYNVSRLQSIAYYTDNTAPPLLTLVLMWGGGVDYIQLF